MRPTTLLASTVIGSLLLLAGTAAAQTYPPPAGPPPGPAPIGWYPEPHDHEGFFARVYLGPAYVSSKASDGANHVEISGGGGAFGLAAGWAINKNLIVYGEIFDDVAVGPTLTINGQSSTADDDVSAGVVGFGAGAAYYFMPVNAFVSGTLSFSELSIQENGQETANTDVGPGVSLMAGKDWWIGRNTGLGVAAQLFFGSQPEKDSSITWHTTAFAVVATLSYN